MATTARTRRVEVRVTDEEHALQEAAASVLGVSVSEFYRHAARARAEEVMAERSRIVLSDADAEKFLNALDHPERFAPKLGWLVERPSVLPSQ
jgi:uncharacterized protein (DUF1778 family)